MRHVSPLVKILKGVAIAFSIQSKCSSSVEGTLQSDPQIPFPLRMKHIYPDQLCQTTASLLTTMHSLPHTFLTSTPACLPPHSPASLSLGSFVTSHPGELPDPWPSPPQADFEILRRISTAPGAGAKKPNTWCSCLFTCLSPCR